MFERISKIVSFLFIACSNIRYVAVRPSVLVTVKPYNNDITMYVGTVLTTVTV